jgi:hypothetical protein
VEKRTVSDDVGGFMVGSLNQIIRSQKGQSLIELTLIAPLMLLLAYGAVEVGSVISTYLTITHTTREGANLTSRGQIPDQALDNVIAAAAPTIRSTNQTQWRVIYSRIIQDGPCPTEPCKYIVDNTKADGQILKGNLNKASKLGTPGTQVTQTLLPGIENVKAGQAFDAIEVFYDYAPSIITYVGKGINTDFYDRTIFTHVSN